MAVDDDYYKQVGIGGDAIVRVQNALDACIKEHMDNELRLQHDRIFTAVYNRSLVAYSDIESSLYKNTPTF